MPLDVASAPQLVAPAAATQVPALRLALAIAVAVAAIAGVAVGAATAPAATPDADLTLLIRLLALMKAAIVLAAGGLVAWRVGSEISSNLAAAYIAAVCLMALSPGLIWSQSSLTLASAFFHSGLLFGLVLAARDGSAKSRR